MSEIQSVQSNVIEILLNSLSLEVPKLPKNDLASVHTTKSSAKTLNEEALSRLANGDYDISIKDYTNLSTYLSKMSALYGDSSASSFQQTINRVLNNGERSASGAKSFIDKMKKNGISNSSAMKLYAALQSYSIVSNMGNYNFVNATA